MSRSTVNENDEKDGCVIPSGPPLSTARPISPQPKSAQHHAWSNVLFPCLPNPPSFGATQFGENSIVFWAEARTLPCFSVCIDGGWTLLGRIPWFCKIHQKERFQWHWHCQLWGRKQLLFQKRSRRENHRHQQVYAMTSHCFHLTVMSLEFRFSLTFSHFHLWALHTMIPEIRWIGILSVSMSTTRIRDVTNNTPPASYIDLLLSNQNHGFICNPSGEKNLVFAQSLLNAVHC